MYKVFPSNRFNKSYKKLRKSGIIFREDLEKIIKILSRGEKLPEKYKDHFLKGDYLGYRECHIKPNLLLIYKIEKSLFILFLEDVGSHSELFR